MRRTADEQAMELATLWRSLTAEDVTAVEYLLMVRRVLSEVRGLDGLVELVTAQAALTSRAVAVRGALPEMSAAEVLQAMALVAETSRP